MVINCRGRLYQTAPAPYLPRLARKTYRNSGWIRDPPRLIKPWRARPRISRRMLRETGASHVPSQNRDPLPDSVGFRHLPGTSSLNSLILLILRNSREEESTQQDWIFLIKRETVQLRRFRISNRYQIGTLSSF